MKASAMLMAICAIAMGATYAPAEQGLGLGLIVGEPTGLSMKKWIDEKQAIDAAAAWSFSENDSFQLHVDYLVHRFNLIKSADIQKGRLPLYFGIGGRIKLRDENEGNGRNDEDTLAGIRVPLGISYLFADTPVDIFGEIVPVVDIAPDTEFDLNAAIGARLYF